MKQEEFHARWDDSASVDAADGESAIGEETIAEMRELMSRYPDPRSALLPMLHLVQSVDGYVSNYAIKVCAQLLGISTAQVNGVATFYTMYKRQPAGEHHIGVCQTSLCAVMGGDQLLEQMEDELGIKAGETTEDGKFSLEALECNAACDFAPVMMVNWEFMDQMTPEKAKELVDNLRANKEVHSTRGAQIVGFKNSSRVLAGFPDGRVDEGPSAGEASLRGLKIAREKGWSAPDPNSLPERQEGGQ